MNKIMDGTSSSAPGVIKKLAAFVADIENGGWCEVRRSLINAYALSILDRDGERFAAATAHLSECPSCRLYVRGLRGLSAVLPPVVLPLGGLGAGTAAGGGGLFELLRQQLDKLEIAASGVGAIAAGGAAGSAAVTGGAAGATAGTASTVAAAGAGTAASGMVAKAAVSVALLGAAATAAFSAPARPVPPTIQQAHAPPRPAALEHGRTVLSAPAAAPPQGHAAALKPQARQSDTDRQARRERRQARAAARRAEAERAARRRTPSGQSRSGLSTSVHRGS